MICSFLVVLRDSVDLMGFQNRDSRFYRLDISQERGNSLYRLNAHHKETGLVHRTDGGLVHCRHSRYQFDNQYKA